MHLSSGLGLFCVERDALVRQSRNARINWLMKAMSDRGMTGPPAGNAAPFGVRCGVGAWWCPWSRLPRGWGAMGCSSTSASPARICSQQVQLVSKLSKPDSSPSSASPTRLQAQQARQVSKLSSKSRPFSPSSAASPAPFSPSSAVSPARSPRA
jgi:hypothetical protein